MGLTCRPTIPLWVRSAQSTPRRKQWSRDSERRRLTIRSTGPIAAGRHMGYKSLAQMPAHRNRPVSSDVRPRVHIKPFSIALVKPQSKLLRAMRHMLRTFLAGPARFGQRRFRCLAPTSQVPLHKGIHAQRPYSPAARFCKCAA